MDLVGEGAEGQKSPSPILPSPRFAHSICPGGEAMACRLRDDGVCVLEWQAVADCQGYEGIVHGGIIALLFDEAMTRLLHFHEIEALTAELKIRYRRPLRVGLPLRVEASMWNESPPLYSIRAFLYQKERLSARAEARFMVPKVFPAV